MNSSQISTPTLLNHFQLSYPHLKRCYRSRSCPLSLRDFAECASSDTYATPEVKLRDFFFISPAIHTTLSPSREYAPNLRTKSNLLSPSLNFAPSHGSHASLFLCKAMHRVSLHISLFSTFWLAFRQLPPPTSDLSVLSPGARSGTAASCSLYYSAGPREI